MKTIFLTSSLGGTLKTADGRREPDLLCTCNGLLNRLKSVWPENARMLFICASPEDFEKNDAVLACLRVSFPLSGLSVSAADICDRRTVQLACRLKEYDVIILTGGHVPTQSAFFHEIGLKEKLEAFDGLILAWSAGSMNCASTVYACPELDGEALDPAYQRWIPGLGLTDINIFPHYDWLKEDVLDGLRIIEEIVVPDSSRHKILAIPDGSYILIEDGRETLFGEGWLIRAALPRKLCDHGESFILSDRGEEKR